MMKTFKEVESVNPTPGPWNYEGGIITADGENPIYRRDVPQNETEANARLIAAAPDLLAALLKLLPEIDFEIEQRQHGGNDEDWAGLQQISDQGHAAIIKATSSA